MTALAPGSDPFEATLACGDLALRVRSSDAAILRWLNEFLAPAFEPRAPADTGASRGADVASLDIRVDAALLERERAALGGEAPGRAEVEAFTLDQGHQRLPLLVDGWDRRVLAHAQAGALLTVREGGRRLELLLGADGDRARFLVLRAAREIATVHAISRGGLPLHAAAFVRPGGGATIITGPRGAGKTSLLTYMLTTGACAYLSNDRVLAMPAGEVRAVPTVVRVREGTAALFPRVIERVRALGHDRMRTIAESEQDRAGARRADVTEDPEGRPAASLSPAQLAAALGCPRVGAAPLERIVLTGVDPGRSGFALTPVDAPRAAARLAEIGLIAGGDVAKLLAEAFGGVPGREALRAATGDLARRVPVVACTLGKGAYDDGRLAEAIVGGGSTRR